MRVTNSMIMSSTLTDLNRTLQGLHRSQGELSSGRRIRTVSDDPAGASSAMTLRGQLRRAEQHERARTDAQSWLSTADSTMVTGLDLMSRIKELAVRAGNAGANGPASRVALAAEVGQLRGEMIALANTKYLGRPVFNGTANGVAYDSSGVYQGDGGAVVREVAPGTTVTVNVTGPDAFGDPAAPEGDLFAVLSRMEAAIIGGDLNGLATEHDHLDSARSRLSSAVSQIGARGARLESVQARSAVDEITMREALSAIEDVDIAEALITVKAKENAYTAALQAASRVVPPSLLDYMR